MVTRKLPHRLLTMNFEVIFDTLILLTEQFLLPYEKQIANKTVTVAAATIRMAGTHQDLNSRCQAKAVITASGTAFARL